MANSQITQQLSNIGRKRPREPTDDDGHSISKKRQRITVEVVPPPKDVTTTRSLTFSKSNANSDVVQQRSATTTQTHSTQITVTEAPPPTRKKTVHQEKVVNGIIHELDRLHDRLAPKREELKDDKRKLRSQEATRFKSELSAYFPEYDEIIGNDPKEDHVLNLDTLIIITDSSKTIPPQASSSQKTIDDEYKVKEFHDDLFTDLFKAQRVDFSFLNAHYDGEEDSMSNAYFTCIHRRPERQEKAIRNSDKGRAQHEKDQVIRLYEGLQGHDWLKLMGVSGVTESKKKEYEPARNYFLKGCENILDKFRIWREEEKRRKLAKDVAAAQSEAEADAEEGDDESVVSDGDPPDYSDVDASAARQLHDEAIARSAPQTSRTIRRPKEESQSGTSGQMEKDFTSFFSKQHLRDQALGKIRRSGRSVPAWGQPLPDILPSDFDLPPSLINEEVLQALARQKRRERRAKKE